MLESGSCAFCVRCQRLFRRAKAAFPDEDDADPLCSDCAQQRRLLDPFTLDGSDAPVIHSPLGSILSKVLARSPAKQQQEEAEEEELASSSTVGGAGHPTTQHASDTTSRDEVALLHALITSLRREANGLRRRLHSALSEAAESGSGAIETSGRADAGEGAGGAAGAASSSGGPVAEVNALLGALIPVQLRNTARYKPLGDRLDALSAAWAGRGRRLAALQAALLLAEATTATLQEELLTVESSEVMLGQLTKSQQAEIASLHRDRQVMVDNAAAKECAAQLAGVRCAEAEALLQLRHDSDTALRSQAREMQRSLADAHTSLDSFVSTQQTRRAKELEQRQALLKEWDVQLKAAVSASSSSSSNAAANAANHLAVTLSPQLDAAMEEHRTALAELDARRREGDGLEREWYERRIDTLEQRVDALETIRVEMAASANEVRGKAVMRQLELLRKQRDEAFSSRALAVDELRQRIVHEGHALAAMRAGFGEGAEQLRSALAQLPLTDESMSHELRERFQLRRRLDGARQRLAREGHARWRRGFVRAHWNGWRELIARSKLTRASHKAKKTVLTTEQKGKQMAAEVEAEVQRRQEEATKAKAELADLKVRLRDAKRREDASAAVAAAAVVEQQQLFHRLKEMEALAAARAGEAALATGALEQARQLEALWYEQREALLEEAEALRHEIELRGDGEKEGKGRWRARAAELSREVDEQRKVADRQRELAQQLQLKLDEATLEAQKAEQALASLERQRVREKANAEAPKPPVGFEFAFSSPPGVGGGGGTPPFPSSPSPLQRWSPASAAAFTRSVDSISSHLHGSSWLVEGRDRQAMATKMEEKLDFYKCKALQAHLEARAIAVKLAVWKEWWTLVLATRRRHDVRLERTIAAAAAVADEARSPSGGQAVPRRPSGGGMAPWTASHNVLRANELVGLAQVDHTEWWLKETSSPTKEKGNKALVVAGGAAVGTPKRRLKKLVA